MTSPPRPLPQSRLAMNSEMTEVMQKAMICQGVVSGTAKRIKPTAPAARPNQSRKKPGASTSSVNSTAPTISQTQPGSSAKNCVIVSMMPCPK